MGWCTTRPRGRGRTTPGFAGSGSRAGRSRSCSTSATAACSTRRARRDALDKAIAELAATPPYRRCRRAARLSARRLHADGVRVDRRARRLEAGSGPQSLGPFLGLTPSENSSGERRRQGAITKTGNTHARRLLIEAAWHQRRPLRASVTLERRRAGKPLAVRAQADRSARRLHGRWHALEARGKPPHDRRGRRRARARRTLLGARDDGVAATLNGSARRAHRRNDARSDPREHCEQPHRATLDARERHRSSSRTPGHAAPTRAYESRHSVDDSRCAPPADKNPQTRAFKPCALDKPHSISAVLDGDYANCVAALKSLRERNEVRELLSFETLIAHYRYIRGLISDGRDGLERALALGVDEGFSHVGAYCSCSDFARLQGDHEKAKQHAETALTLARRAGVPR